MHHKDFIGEGRRPEEDDTSFMAMGRASSDPSSSSASPDEATLGGGGENGDDVSDTGEGIDPPLSPSERWRTRPVSAPTWNGWNIRPSVVASELEEGVSLLLPTRSFRTARGKRLARTTTEGREDDDGGNQAQEGDGILQ